MEQRVSVITLGVADLERARRFYEGGLGWRRGNADPSVVFFQIPGAVFHTYDGVGHLPPIEAADRFSRDVVAFFS